MNRYQEISRSLVRQKLRETLEQQRLEKELRRTRAGRGRPNPVPAPKLH